MTCVLQMAPGDPDINVSLLLSLHFMMMQHDFAKHPGRWRPGAVWVTSTSGEVVYEAPDREFVEPLVAEALAQIAHSDGPAPVTAAMAHLNLTLIHPFSDGNGRMARCLQTLVLAAAGERTTWRLLYYSPSDFGYYWRHVVHSASSASRPELLPARHAGRRQEHMGAPGASRSTTIRLARRGLVHRFASRPGTVRPAGVERRTGRLDRGRRGAADTRLAQRGSPAHLRARRALRAVGLQRTQAKDRGHQPARRSGAAQDDAPSDGGRTGRRL
ncbi:MAG: Fic family protein [Acidimicrobiia bacterium]|nr:Fic family protein [Acidimicrobiia bacterium]